MKTIIRIIFVFSFLTGIVSDSFTTPLIGTYTVGSGGSYPTIASAVEAASIQGILGDVIFDILPGTSADSVLIPVLPGSNGANTLTLKSQSGNPADVIISHYLEIFSQFVLIRQIKMGGVNMRVNIKGSYIALGECDFNYSSLQLLDSAQTHEISIIQNSNIGSINFQGTGPLVQQNPTNIHFIDNTIFGTVEIYNCRDVDIEGNTINGSVHNLSVNTWITKNKITGVVSTQGADINNNFIIGRMSCPNSVLVYNTIVGGSFDTATITASPGLFSNNNIIINPTGGKLVHAVSITGFNYDYNDYYNRTDSNLIQIGNTTYNSIVELFIATGLDQHSVSKSVAFVSAEDLHLTGISIGDEDLIAKPFPGYITSDIDNDLRDNVYPYKGADEAPTVLPVELLSFISSVNNSNLTLKWLTANEINNFGFDIEKSIAESQWFKAGFVKGEGTSNIPFEYTFTEKNLPPGKYRYRLKQIDLNGSFKYFDLSGEVIIGIPEKYELSQNFPNPFNPSTVIRYSLTQNGFTSLKIFDITGKEVAGLVNQKQDAGRYEVTFNANNFASGVYFYELRSGDFVSQKRMLLLK